jgi:hypothetical protein
MIVWIIANAAVVALWFERISPGRVESVAPAAAQP